MYMTISEYKSPDYTISYDPNYDILRLNNKLVANFSYEDYHDNFYLMIDENTKEVIGAQIMDFITNRDQTISVTERLEFTSLKKAIVKSLSIVEDKLK